MKFCQFNLTKKYEPDFNVKRTNESRTKLVQTAEIVLLTLT